MTYATVTRYDFDGTVVDTWRGDIDTRANLIKRMRAARREFELLPDGSMRRPHVELYAYDVIEWEAS